MQLKEILIDTHNSIQDKYLDILCTKNIPIKIFLRNGIALQGFIEAYDQAVVILRNETSQLVYKCSIASIMPTFGIKKIIRKNTIDEQLCV